jgi:hypothetical protein
MAVAVSIAACGGEHSPAPPTKPTADPTVQLVEIEGTFQLASPGLTTQLRAFATYSDGVQYDVTRDAVWTVLNEGVVRVAPGGVATATGYGDTTVLASYGGVVSRYGFGFRVTALAGPQHALTGVVRDASTGAPLGRAQAVSRFSGVTQFAANDDNGFFDLGTAAGPTAITVARVGYEDAVVRANIDAATRLTVSLVPMPGSFVERSMEDGFTESSGAYGTHTYRISTKPGAPFDVQVQGLDCDSSPQLTLSARSSRGDGQDGNLTYTCYARVRLYDTDGDATVTVTGRNVTRFRLTYRESR